MRTCPKCGKSYVEAPAISRTDDRTEICPKCGLLEALEAVAEHTRNNDQSRKTVITDKP